MGSSNNFFSHEWKVNMIKTTNSPDNGNPKWHQFQRHLPLKGNQKIKCDLCYIPIRKKHPQRLFRPQISFSDKISLCCSGEETQNMESLIDRYVLCSYFQYYSQLPNVTTKRKEPHACIVDENIDFH